MARGPVHPGSIGLLFVGTLLLAGCATVHQIPGADEEKLVVFGTPSRKNPLPPPDSTFTMTLSQAVTFVMHTCYDLRVPLYVPLTSSDSSQVRLTSGIFTARCELDCRCGFVTASGHGADRAAGIIVVELSRIGIGTDPRVLARVSSMFWRTETDDSGDGSATENRYFSSLGRIEGRILGDLKTGEARLKWLD